MKRIVAGCADRDRGGGIAAVGHFEDDVGLLNGRSAVNRSTARGSTVTAARGSAIAAAGSAVGAVRSVGYRLHELISAVELEIRHSRLYAADSYFKTKSRRRIRMLGIDGIAYAVEYIHIINLGPDLNLIDACHGGAPARASGPAAARSAATAVGRPADCSGSCQCRAGKHPLLKILHFFPEIKCHVSFSSLQQEDPANI